MARRNQRPRFYRHRPAAVGCSLTLVLACLLPAAARANPVKSLYTTIELKECRAVKRHQHGRAWLCPGLAGFPVLIAEDQAHQFVSIGERPEKHRAASQTFTPPNTIFEAGGRRPTIEWRFVRRFGREVPYAAIVGYFVGAEPKRARVLVVTKIEEGQSCHVAYVEATSNAEAIVQARAIADEEARSFDCRSEPKRIGAVNG